MKKVLVDTNILLDGFELEEGSKKYIFQEEYLISRKSKNIEYTINENNCFICVSHFPAPKGYFSIIRNGKREYLHRYIYRTSKGNIGEDMVVMHTCDNRYCINPDHLTLGTQLENMRDCTQKGRRAVSKGEKNGNSKLTDEEVVEIKKDTTTSQKILASRFGVKKSIISAIQRGVKWSHISVEGFTPRENVIKKRFSESEILHIKNEKILTTRELSKYYNVGDSVISRIRRGLTHNKKNYSKT